MNLLLLAALLVAAFLLLHYRRARALLDDWIGSQQLQLLHARLALAPPLSMLLTTSKAQVVYRIRVYDPAQQRIRRKLRSRPKERSKEEQDLINEAKALLMERNNMTESEAHRYIQKCSMDSGTNLVETAQMIISLIHV